jgi:NAD+ diphosphatase
MPSRFQSGVEPAGPPPESSLWFAFRRGDLLVVGERHTRVLPAAAEPRFPAMPIRRQYLGLLDGTPCWSVELPEDAPDPGDGEFVELRALWGALDERLWALAGRAAQVVAWERDHQFCGRCGTPTEQVPGERARRCPACSLLSYPRISPAVITLIEREDRILLARGHGFPPGRFGIIAGFVEPGETFEETVEREVTEEVGIELSDVTYFASQPWPFPHGIMVGFTAQWASGEITPDSSEIAEAGWYGIDDLPNIPPKLSIARRLIDDWALRRHGVEVPETASW